MGRWAGGGQGSPIGGVVEGDATDVQRRVLVYLFHSSSF